MDDPLVLEVALACKALHLEPWDFWDDAFQATLPVVGHPVYYRRAELLDAKGPATKEEALRTLLRLVASETARLLDRKAASLDARASAEVREAASRALVDTTPPASLRLRYGAAAERSLYRALAEIDRRRKADPDRRAKPEPPEPVEKSEVAAGSADPPPAAPRRPSRPRNEPNAPAPLSSPGPRRDRERPPGNAD